MSVPHPTRTAAADLTDVSRLDPAGGIPAPRLRLEPTGSSRTLLDGGWWPRSKDPVAELPDLVLAIGTLRGPVTRLVLSADGWDSHPRRLTVGGLVLRLGWFTSQPASLLTAICLNGDRVDLLVVPTESAGDLAEGAMALPATAGNRIHAPQLLSAANTLRARNADSVGESAWEAEGGRHLGPAATGVTTTVSRAPVDDMPRMFPAQRPPPGPAPPPYPATAGDVRNGPMRDIKEQPMKIARHRITDALRARGQHVRADWIRRELPDEVDLAQHAGLLATLHLDPADLAEAPTT